MSKHSSDTVSELTEWVKANSESTERRPDPAVSVDSILFIYLFFSFCGQMCLGVFLLICCISGNVAYRLCLSFTNIRQHCTIYGFRTDLKFGELDSALFLKFQEVTVTNCKSD